MIQNKIKNNKNKRNSGFGIDSKYKQKHIPFLHIVRTRAIIKSQNTSMCLFC